MSLLQFLLAEFSSFYYVVNYTDGLIFVFDLIFVFFVFLQ